MFKELFTGGQQVQEAKRKQKSLESRNRLSASQQADLADVRRITRRHALKLIGGGTAALGIASAGGAASWMLLGKNSEPSTRQETSQPVELTQETLDKVTTRSVDDFNRLFGLNLPTAEIVAKTKLVPTHTEFLAITSGDTKKEYDPTGRIEAVTFDQSSPYGKSMIYNKEAIGASLQSTVDRGNFGQLQEEYLEMLVKHELVHFTGKRYNAPQIHSVVYEKMFANEPTFAGQPLTPAYVQGADVTTFVGNDPIGKNPFHSLEEAEAFTISDFALRARGRELVLEPFRAVDMGLSAQVDLLSKTLTKIDPDPFKTVPDLMRLRMRDGGREEFCATLAKAYPEANVEPGEEIFFGMSICYAIARGDARVFEAIT